MREFTSAIKSKFEAQGLTKVATREVGRGVLRLAAPFDAQVALILPLVGLQVEIKN
jgi:hypothetical protein